MTKIREGYVQTDHFVLHSELFRTNVVISELAALSGRVGGIPG